MYFCPGVYTESSLNSVFVARLRIFAQFILRGLSLLSFLWVSHGRFADVGGGEGGDGNSGQGGRREEGRRANKIRMVQIIRPANATSPSKREVLK